MTECDIRQVEKRRSGGYRYWCMTHMCDATEKYGIAAKACRRSGKSQPEIVPVAIDPSHYAGGIAIWGAVPPVYDTSTLCLDRGIHVHARHVTDGDKVIDETFRSIEIVIPHQTVATKIPIDEIDAIYFMVSSIFDMPIETIKCTYCGNLHLDRDWFSVHAHRRHLCHHCGRYFRDTTTAVGNPAAAARTAVEGITSHRVVPASGTLDIRQADFPGGIRIWGSNRALVWTSTRPEESGIHVHALDADNRCLADGTYGHVIVDGVELDADAVRLAMAQRALPHLTGKIHALACPECATSHLDTAAMAFEPHDSHRCGSCGVEFSSAAGKGPTIGNPMDRITALMARTAVREPQEIRLQLDVEI